MRRFDFIVLAVLMVLSAVNSFGAVLSTSNSEQKSFFETCLADPNGPCKALDTTILQNIMKEVNDDIASEAAAAGKSREEYLSTDAPFELLLNAMQSDEFKNMDRADTTISIIKLGIRYRTIQATRFVAPHFIQNEEQFLKLVRDVSAQHHLPFEL